MEMPGLVGTLSMVTGVLLAIPMGLIGVEFLAQGRYGLGFAFLALAALLLVLPEYVQRRLLRSWMTRVRDWRD